MAAAAVVRLDRTVMEPTAAMVAPILTPVVVVVALTAVPKALTVVAAAAVRAAITVITSAAAIPAHRQAMKAVVVRAAGTHLVWVEQVNRFGRKP